MDTFWNKRRKTERTKLEREKKEIYDKWLKDRIIRDIRTIFEQREEKDYYKLKRVSNF